MKQDQTHFKILLIFISAILFGLPFIFPENLCFLIFLFLIPIFYLQQANIFLKFSDGLLWGATTFAISTYGILWMAIERGESVLKWFVWPLLLLNLSIYSGLWFWATTLLCKRLNLSIVLLPITFFYFWWNDTGIFWVMGEMEGCCLLNPLLPLATFPSFLSTMTWFKFEGQLFCLIGWQFFIVNFLMDRKKINLLLALFFAAPFLIGFFIKQQQPKFFLNEEIFGYCLPSKKIHSPVAAAQEIALNLMDSVKQFPTAKVILMPESSFAFPLNQFEEYLQFWDEVALKGRRLILGSHRKEGANLYNCLFVLHQGRIINFYDKTHRFFLTERIPSYLNFMRNIFLKKKVIFNLSNQKKNNLCLNGQNFSCAICSDLFFKNSPCYQNCCSSGLPIIFLVNEDWFSCTYLHKACQLYANMKAMEFGVTIIFVGHRKFTIF